MAKAKALPSREDLFRHLRYDHDTGLLWWKQKGLGRSINRPAGTKSYQHRDGSPRAITITLEYENYSAHRLIWRMVTGDDPAELSVDHINRNPFDNRWSNLRLADHSLQNRNKRAHGVSAYKGVCYCKAAKKWQAVAYVEGKAVFLGRFEKEEEAGKAAAPYFII